MELRLPLEVSPGREATCRAVFGTWGSFPNDARKNCPSCGLHSQAGVRRGVRASGSYQEGTGKSGSYGMWNHPRGHVWNVFGDRHRIIRVLLNLLTNASKYSDVGQSIGVATFRHEGSIFAEITDHGPGI